MHILSNISRSKGNQRMNFGQLIECENMRNTFVDKSYINHTQLWTIAFTLFKAFLKKTKRGLELVSLPHFLHDF